MTPRDHRFQEIERHLHEDDERRERLLRFGPGYDTLPPQPQPPPPPEQSYEEFIAEVIERRKAYRGSDYA